MEKSGKLVALIASVGLTLALLACGRPPPADGTGGGPTGFGSQLCGRTGAEVPGYRATLPVLASQTRRLSGAGSTFIAPVMSVWAKRYAALYGTQVAYQPIGSGGGLAQVLAGTVDFGAVDTPMTDAERARADRTVLHIPVALGAVVPAYHVRGLGSGLRFDGDALGGIFAGAIERWDDPALRRLNPGVVLPDRPIVVVHRSDASGTTAVWTDFLTKRSAAWVAALKPGHSTGKQVVWPVGLAGKGNDGVAGMLAQVDGGIGYLELAYVLTQSLHYGQVRNRSGAFVQPCPATVIRASDGVDYPADLRFSLTDGTDPAAYPIAGVTYVLVPTGVPDPSVAAALINFLSWVLTAGQDLVSEIGYAPLGPSLQHVAYAQLCAVSVAGASPPCPPA